MASGASLVLCPPDPSVPGAEVLGFFKIEIERKSQRNFQADFIKLMLKHEGGSSEDRKVLPSQGLALLGYFYQLGRRQACVKKWACRKGGRMKVLERKFPCQGVVISSFC